MVRKNFVAGFVCASYFLFTTGGAVGRKNKRRVYGMCAFRGGCRSNAPVFRQSCVHRGAFRKDMRVFCMPHGGCRRKDFWHRAGKRRFVGLAFVLRCGIRGIIRLTSCWSPCDTFAQSLKQELLRGIVPFFFVLCPNQVFLRGEKEQMFCTSYMLPPFWGIGK